MLEYDVETRLCGKLRYKPERVSQPRELQFHRYRPTITMPFLAERRPESAEEPTSLTAGRGLVAEPDPITLGKEIVERLR